MDDFLSMGPFFFIGSGIHTTAWADTCSMESALDHCYVYLFLITINHFILCGNIILTPKHLLIRYTFLTEQTDSFCVY